MTGPRDVEILACGYSARCSAPGCRRRATTILRYLDAQGRFDHQTDACDTHASELGAELRVIDRRLSLCIESQSMKPRQVRSKLNAHPKTSLFSRW
jgi:hypothetical protein